MSPLASVILSAAMAATFGPTLASVTSRCDSLSVLAARMVFRSDTSRAEGLFRAAMDADSTCVRAIAGLGEIMIRRGDMEGGLRYFDIAEELQPDAGHASFGRGLAAERAGDYDTAQQRFMSAFSDNRSNPAYSDAMARCYREPTQRWNARQRLMRAIRADPTYAPALIRLARYYESESQYEEAAALYRDYLAVVPTDVGAALAGAATYLEIDSTTRARRVLIGAQHRVPPERRAEYELIMAASFVLDMRFDAAARAYGRAFALLPAEERCYYEDASLVLSRDDMTEYQSATASSDSTAASEFAGRMWNSRDITPATELNERRLEHYRRVWYSRLRYSTGQQPWDRRGAVYIRYGPPAHITSARRPDVRLSPRVDEARESYARRLGMRRSLSAGSRAGMVPIYPLPMLGKLAITRSARDWTEWIYPGVAGGLAILLTDEYGTGVYDFGPPPSTARGPILMHSPANEFVRARMEEPERYEYSATLEPFDFHYYQAQFRGTSDSTDLAVFYALPIEQLEFERSRARTDIEAELELGYAVFDDRWQLRSRAAENYRIRAPEGTVWELGSVHVDNQQLSVAPHERILLSVQAKDVISGRLQAYRETIETEQFDDSTLALSDIVLAGRITADADSDCPAFARGGLCITPLATRAFRIGQPIHVYVEIYNLSRDEYGRTRYEVEHVIRSGADEQGVVNALGRFFNPRQRVGVGRVLEGVRQSDSEHFAIGTEALEARDYTLVISVRDLHTDHHVLREQKFRITEQVR